MQDNIDIYEYDRNTLQQKKTLFEHNGIGNVIMKETKKGYMNCKL